MAPAVDPPNRNLNLEIYNLKQKLADAAHVAADQTLLLGVEKKINEDLRTSINNIKEGWKKAAQLNHQMNEHLSDQLDETRAELDKTRREFQDYIDATSAEKDSEYQGKPCQQASELAKEKTQKAEEYQADLEKEAKLTVDGEAREEAYDQVRSMAGEAAKACYHILRKMTVNEGMAIHNRNDETEAEKQQIHKNEEGVFEKRVLSTQPLLNVLWRYHRLSGGKPLKDMQVQGVLSEEDENGKRLRWFDDYFMEHIDKDKQDFGDKLTEAPLLLAKYVQKTQTQPQE